MGEFLKAQSFWSRLSGFLQLVRVTVSATAAVVVVMVAVWLGTPVKWLLQTELLLHPQNANALLVSIGNIAAALLPYNGSLPTDIPSLNQPVQIQQGRKMFLIVSPTVPLNNTNTNGSSNSDNSQDAATTTMEQMLGDWYHQNLDWFQKSLQSHGGVLLRGFPLDNPQQFDRLVANIHRDAVGTGVYLGTARRTKIPGTRFVSSASDIPRLGTIPTHLELCYTPHPPDRLYFFVQQLNKPPGGQTPFSDFQQAWEELNEELKAKLVRKGLRYERRYYNDKARKPIDPLQSKSWQDMFMTESKEEVEEMARQEEFEPVWEDNDNLLLTHTAIVNRTHNGKSVWNTHFNVLHANSFGVPFAQSAQILDSKISLFLSWLIPTFNAINRWRGYEYGHDLVFADDHSQVTYKEALQIRNAISRNTWIFDWNEGDVLILDNRRIAHGRLPYFYGTRKVYVAWQ